VGSQGYFVMNEPRSTDLNPCALPPHGTLDE